MQALRRKPNLEVKRTMKLDAETELSIKGIPAKEMVTIVNDKSLSDYEKGLHRAACKLLVNGQPIVYDDLVDCFTDDELITILTFVNGEEEGKNG